MDQTNRKFLKGDLNQNYYGDKVSALASHTSEPVVKI